MLGTKPFITNIIDSKVGASEKNSEDKISEVKFLNNFLLANKCDFKQAVHFSPEEGRIVSGWAAV